MKPVPDSPKRNASQVSPKYKHSGIHRCSHSEKYTIKDALSFLYDQQNVQLLLNITQSGIRISFTSCYAIFHNPVHFCIETIKNILQNIYSLLLNKN